MHYRMSEDEHERATSAVPASNEQPADGANSLKRKTFEASGDLQEGAECEDEAQLLLQDDLLDDDDVEYSEEDADEEDEEDEDYIILDDDIQDDMDPEFEESPFDPVDTANILTGKRRAGASSSRM